MNFNIETLLPLTFLNCCRTLGIDPCAFMILGILVLLYLHLVWLLRRVIKPISEYNLVIENQKDFYNDLGKLINVILLVAVLFSWRFRTKPRDIAHILTYQQPLEAAYFFESILPIAFLIILATVLFSLFVISRLYILLFVYRVKVLCIRLHIFCLQLRSYKSISTKMTFLRFGYYKFYYNQLKKLFNNQNIAVYGIYIHRATIFLENHLSKYLIFYVGFSEYLTKNGGFDFTLRLLPYYSLYNIIRFCIKTWSTWFEDQDYFFLSLQYYQNPDKKQEINNLVANFYTLPSKIKKSLFNLLDIIIVLLQYLVILHVLSYSLFGLGVAIYYAIPMILLIFPGLAVIPKIFAKIDCIPLIYKSKLVLTFIAVFGIKRPHVIKYYYNRRRKHKKTYKNYVN